MLLPLSYLHVTVNAHIFFLQILLNYIYIYKQTKLRSVLSASDQHKDLCLQIVKRSISSSERILSNPVRVGSTLISRPSVT